MTTGMAHGMPRKAVGEVLARCHGNQLCRGFPFPRMPWKAVSSFCLQGGESALPALLAVQG